jgi:hypothetical protein
MKSVAFHDASISPVLFQFLHIIMDTFDNYTIQVCSESALSQLLCSQVS